MHIILFEDHLVAENRPITLMRPAFAVSVAATCLYDLARLYGSRVSCLVRAYLRPKVAEQFGSALPPSEETLFLNAALVPSFELIERLVQEVARGGNCVVRNGERVAAAYFDSLPAGYADQDERSITRFLLERDYRTVRMEWPLVSLPFEVIKHHQKYFVENIRRMTVGLTETRPGVFVGAGVKIHPTAVLETSEGPIVLRDGVTVGPFALMIGPLIVGSNSRIIERATIKEMVQIGHTCKIGGEIECSIIEPYANKQHHGFLGHSYVGSWVNLGAGTTNSDLKNTYGHVSVEHGGRRLQTDMQFLGCVIGDYSKTAINTSIFTGKIIGVSSFLYGFVGTNVPSFTNYARTFGQQTECVLDAAVRTQERMFARRKMPQGQADIALLEHVFQMTRDERSMPADQLSF